MASDTLFRSTHDTQVYKYLLLAYIIIPNRSCLPCLISIVDTYYSLALENIKIKAYLPLLIMYVIHTKFSRASVEKKVHSQ